MATGAQGCTALDLFSEHRALFRFCDKVLLLTSFSHPNPHDTHP
jgi:hypothetical protein